MSDEERHQILRDFLDEVLGGLEIDPRFASMMRSAMPNLPEDPSPEQVAAWVELAELVQDQDFRRRIRGMSEFLARERAAGHAGLSRETGAVVTRRAQEAMAAGIRPDAAEAGPVLDGIVATLAAAEQTDDGPAFRTHLLEGLRAGSDARAERYWQLLVTINGWPTWPDTTPTFEWIIRALQAR
jgi:hypothetical protein